MDEELLELSKRVYKLLPEWETEDWWAKSAYSGNYSVVPSKSYSSKSFSDEGDAGSYYDYLPHYTSDYLLEKLPTNIGDKWLNVGPITNQTIPKHWAASYESNNLLGYDEWSDTARKALLKLALALKEVGEI